MAIAHLVNDTQSYQKEQADGKMNLVLLYLNENPNATIKDSISYVNQILEVKRKAFLKQVFTEGNMQKTCKQIHLSCMKVFEMFYNSTNLFGRETTLADEIQRAIYIPIVHKPKQDYLLKPMPSVPYKMKKKTKDITMILTTPRPILKHSGTTSFIKQGLVNKFPFSVGRVKVNVR